MKRGDQFVDFVKLKSIVDQNKVADVVKIDDHKIKVIYRSGNGTFESELIYEQYKSEEELAAAINTEFDRTTQSKINTSLK